VGTILTEYHVLLIRMQWADFGGGLLGLCPKRKCLHQSMKLNVVLSCQGLHTRVFRLRRQCHGGQVAPKPCQCSS
jgi:hypothetical protein